MIRSWGNEKGRGDSRSLYSRFHLNRTDISEHTWKKFDALESLAVLTYRNLIVTAPSKKIPVCWFQ